MKEQSSGTLSVLVLRGLLVALVRAGADTDALLADLGITRTVLDRGEGRLPATVVFRALELAPALTGDPCFCLHAAAAIPMGTLEVVDFAMKSSQTLGEALSRATRYYALIDDSSELRLEQGGDLARLVGYRTTLPSPRAATELLFALVLDRGRRLTGRAWTVREVSFLRGPPREVEGYERFFGAPVHFGQRRNEIVFDASWLDVPCVTRDPALAGFFDRHASGLLRQLPGPATFLEEVRAAIAESIRGSDPRLEVTAKRLATSPRTLQRRLDDHGTSHTQLVEDVRRDLAERFLADPGIAIGEVAYLLGFFDASTFHRAFKRWTGATPAEYRHGVARQRSGTAGGRSAAHAELASSS